MPEAVPSSDLVAELKDFVATVVEPAERRYQREATELGGRSTPPVMADLQREAQRRGLWNLCLSDPEWGRGLTNSSYAPLAEITGRCAPAAEATNGAGPDSVNMETLLRVGTEEQKEWWLRPLAEGTCRSCFAMTEPEVAGSDHAPVHAPPRPGELRRNALDPTRARIHLGWRSWTTLADGTRAVLEHVRASTSPAPAD